MLSSIALYQIRASRPEVSRDKDVFFSSVGLLCGGILVFQGWRLDPLMLFGQLMTAGTAVAFASETISLRQNLLEVEEERGYGGLSDDDDDEYYDDEEDEFGGRRGRRGRRGGGGGGRGRRGTNNRGYALPSQTQSGFRRFDDSFDDLYEEEEDARGLTGRGGFSSVSEARYIGNGGSASSSGGGGSRMSSPSAAVGYSSTFYEEEEEEDEEAGSDFSREFQRSSASSRGGQRRREERDEDEDDDDDDKASPPSSKPSLDVWGSEGDDVF
jgi:hypothetical protein